MSIKLSELAEKVKKLEHKVRKIGDEEREPRKPTEYNMFISKHIHDFKGNAQNNFASAVKLWHDKHDGKKLKTHKKEEHKERKEERKKKEED